VTVFADTRSFERMSALEAGFLHAETDRTPMHLGSLTVFEGTPFFDDEGGFRIEAVRARVEERLGMLPRFRRRVAEVPFGQGRPVWVDDTAFDIAHHVRLMVLPEPGSREELAALCAQLHMRLLDRDHPLWELWFVGGLDDGGVAMIEKVHHAVIDGVSGVEVAAALLDLEPRVEPVTSPPWTPVPPPDPLPLLAESVRQRIVEPAEWLRTMRALARGPREVAARLGGLADGVRTLASAPVRRTSLTDPVGHRRRLAWVATDLASVRDAAHRREATVNDVVLAAVTAGLRDVLRSRDEDVEDLELHALVPVSTRTPDEHGSFGNRVSAIVAPLPVGTPEPDDVLTEIRDAMTQHKQRHQAQGTELLVEGLELVPPAVLAISSRAVHHQPIVDVVITNVPGPAAPLYFLGARLVEAVPIVPLAGNLSIGIAVLSYDGDLTLGFYADRDRWEDLEVLTDAVDRAFTAYASLGSRS
jgi:WS/DGAT/MGAT family acyltransferase